MSQLVNQWKTILRTFTPRAAQRWWRVDRETISQLQVDLQLRCATRLHLGCGGHLIPDWANVDLERREGVISFDLTKPLPCPSGSIKYIYSEHFIEHVRRDQGCALLRECHRVLRDDGILRVSTPDLRTLTTEYLGGRITEWSDMGWQPKTPCQMVNEGMRLWGHEFLYDEPELKALLSECGFQNIISVDWRQSKHAELRGLECRPYHNDLIFEATKSCLV
jgi:predicted SAM-dependent methyltransferase